MADKIKVPLTKGLSPIERRVKLDSVARQQYRRNPSRGERELLRYNARIDRMSRAVERMQPEAFTPEALKRAYNTDGASNRRPAEPGSPAAKAEAASAKAAPKVSAKRQAAIDAFIKASPSGRAPPKSMSIKAMDAYVARWQAHRNYQDSKLRPGGPVNPTPKPGTVAPIPAKPVSNFKRAYDAASPEKQARMREGLAGIQKSLGEARDLLKTIKLPSQHTVGSYSGSATATYKHMGLPNPSVVTNDVAMGHASPAPVGPGRMARAMDFIGEHQGKMALGVAAGSAAIAYAKTGDAKEAAKAAAIPALMGAARPVGSGLQTAGSVMLGAAGTMFENVGVVDWMFGMPLAKAAGATAIVGGATYAAGTALKIASKAALPISLGVAAYQIGKAAYNGGAQAALKETGRQALGIATFGVSELAIAGHDIYKSRVAARAQGQSVAMGSPAKSQTWEAPSASKDMAAFKKADASFDQNTLAHHGDQLTGPTGRGWGNPAVQAAAQEARGVKNKTDWARA